MVTHYFSQYKASSTLALSRDFITNKKLEVVVRVMQSELVQLVNSWHGEDKELRMPKEGLDIPMGDRSIVAIKSFHRYSFQLRKFLNDWLVTLTLNSCWIFAVLE